MGGVNLNQLMNTEPPEITKPVEKTRIDLVNEMLTNYPIDKYSDWYMANHPDIYAAYMFAKEQFSVTKPVTIKKKARMSIKMLALLLGIIGVFAVIVFFVVMYFLNQGMLLFP